jgi:hypothetical protein
MLDDQTFTGRQQYKPQPGACLHCHGSMYVPYRKAGNGDLIKGFETMNPMPYAEEAARILAESIDFSRKGQVTLAGLTIQVPSPAPAKVEAAQAAGG